MGKLEITEHDDTQSEFSPDTTSTASSSGELSNSSSAGLALNDS